MDFKGLFYSYITDDVQAAFSDITVKKCDLDMSDRMLLLSLESGKYINQAQKDRFEKEIADKLKLSGIDMNLTFKRTAFCEAAIEDIVSRLKKKNVALNGYFNSAEYSVSGEKIDIKLKFGGYETITGSGFEKNFAAEVFFSCLTVS